MIQLLQEIIRPGQSYDYRWFRVKEFFGIEHIGILFRWSAGWIGYHYNPKYKKLCINPFLFITIWITGFNNKK